LSFGGSTGSPLATTEKFNGSIWSTTGNLNTARYGLAGCGLQSAALSIGGTTTGSDYLATTEKFDGSTWTVTGSLNIARFYLAGCGSQSFSITFGGSTGVNSGVTEKFDGSIWTTTGNLNTARRYLAGCGAQSPALSFGGYTGSVLATTEKFTTGSSIDYNIFNTGTSKYSVDYTVDFNSSPTILSVVQS